MKKALFAILLLLCISTGVIIVTISQDNIENLILCASDENASYIPATICEHYLLKFRGNQADIEYLTKRTGLNFLANIEDPVIRTKLFEFFIDKGMDINLINQIDGLTPLHAAILLNDDKLLGFLLRKGANPQLRDRNKGLTPLEFLEQMEKQLPGIDRTRLKQLLKK